MITVFRNNMRAYGPVSCHLQRAIYIIRWPFVASWYKPYLLARPISSASIIFRRYLVSDVFSKTKTCVLFVGKRRLRDNDVYSLYVGGCI